MTWFIIDHQGKRPISEEWMQQRRLQSHQGLMWGIWHSFVQVAIHATPTELYNQLAGLAPTCGLTCTPCQQETANAIIGKHEQWSLLTEPDVDVDLCFINADTIDEFFRDAPFDGMYYGYDEDAGIVHFARFEQGRMAFLWYDAFLPGPSFALTFHEDGTCTEEDARQHAIERMNLPKSTTQLDRFAFLEHLLREYGMEHFDPTLQHAQITHTLALVPSRDVEQSKHP